MVKNSRVISSASSKRLLGQKNINETSDKNQNEKEKEEQNFNNEIVPYEPHLALSQIHKSRETSLDSSKHYLRLRSNSKLNSKTLSGKEEGKQNLKNDEVSCEPHIAQPQIWKRGTLSDSSKRPSRTSSSNLSKANEKQDLSNELVLYDPDVSQLQNQKREEKKGLARNKKKQPLHGKKKRDDEPLSHKEREHLFRQYKLCVIEEQKKLEIEEEKQRQHEKKVEEWHQSVHNHTFDRSIYDQPPSPRFRPESEMFLEETKEDIEKENWNYELFWGLRKVPMSAKIESLRKAPEESFLRWFLFKEIVCGKCINLNWNDFAFNPYGIENLL